MIIIRIMYEVANINIFTILNIAIVKYMFSYLELVIYIHIARYTFMLINTMNSCLNDTLNDLQSSSLQKSVVRK